MANLLERKAADECTKIIDRTHRMVCALEATVVHSNRDILLGSKDELNDFLNGIQDSLQPIIKHITEAKQWTDSLAEDDE